MNREQVVEKYGELLADWYCVEAYIHDESLYYRYDAAEPVTEPGQISFKKITDTSSEPIYVSVLEFHEAQKGDKLKQVRFLLKKLTDF